MKKLRISAFIQARRGIFDHRKRFVDARRNGDLVSCTVEIISFFYLS